MSQDSSWEVQSAIFHVLTNNANLTSLLAEEVNSVCDHVLSNAIFPYIVIGESSGSEFECGGFAVNITIHSYSKTAGMSEIKQIMAETYNALNNQEFNIPNHKLILCLMQSSNVKLAGDGKTRHGVQQFRIITEEV